MREQILTWVASAVLIAEASLPAKAATVDIDALTGGTTFTCCGGDGSSSISGYLTPLYTFNGGTVDFGTVQLSPYVEIVGPSMQQVFMGSVSSSNGPLVGVIPTVLYGDVCIDGYGYNCGNLYYPTPVTQSLLFAFPDNEATEFQMAFIGSFDYSPPAVTPLPPTWILMLTALAVLAGLTYWRGRNSVLPT